MFGRHVDENRIAAPFFRYKLIFCQFLLDFIRVGFRFVDFVDCHNDRQPRRFGVVDRFNRLRHHAVVSRNDDDRNVGQLRSARPHRRKRLVTRRVEERDLLAVDLDLISADMLRNAAGFAAGHVRRTDRVQQRRFPVVDVPHNRHDRRTLFQIRLIVNLFDRFKTVFLDRNFHFDFNAEIAGQKLDRLDVELLVDRGHNAEQHQLFDHLGSVFMQQFRGFANGHRAADNDFLRRIVDFFARRLLISATAPPAAFAAAVVVFKVSATVVVKTFLIFAAMIAFSALTLAFASAIVIIAAGRNKIAVWRLPAAVCSAVSLAVSLAVAAAVTAL